jgi:hypothetical protein
LITTGRVTLENAAPTNKPMELPAGWVSQLWLAEGQGMVQALNNALDIYLGREATAILMGEDVGRFGGVFRVSEGLQQKYGAERVFDTPLAEAGIVGTAIGMALGGLQPIVEIQFADFVFPAFDQLSTTASTGIAAADNSVKMVIHTLGRHPWRTLSLPESGRAILPIRLGCAW